MPLTSQKLIGRPTWAKIDLDALAHNFAVIRKHVGPDIEILAAIKANAYGHGAVECARRLEAEGVDWFGVALPEEGIELRLNGITKPILCLGGFWRGQEGVLMQQELTPVVYRIDMVESLNRAAVDAGSTMDMHVKIDTGMGRLGIKASAAAEFCHLLAPFANIRVAGLMTHLASADVPAHNEFTSQQIGRFDEAINVFCSHGYAPRYIHAANSAATFAFAAARGNLVRPGGALYGFSRDVLPPNIDAPPLLSVMSLHTRIAMLKEVSKGGRLGYGGTFETKRDSLIATLPIGYDDGYPRALSNRGRVIVREKFAPVVGRVSMDLTLIDVTDVPAVSTNDQVTLLGRDGALTISAEDLGELAGTISYEITCGISNRVPREFSARSSA